MACSFLQDISTCSSVRSFRSFSVDTCSVEVLHELQKDNVSHHGLHRGLQRVLGEVPPSSFSLVSTGLFLSHFSHSSLRTDVQHSYPYLKITEVPTAQPWVYFAVNSVRLGAAPCLFSQKPPVQLFLLLNLDT